MRRFGAAAIAALLLATAVVAQDTPVLDPLIERIDVDAFERDGACYLERFNAEYSAGFTAEGVFRALVAVPAADDIRRAPFYDRLLSVSDLAIGQTCDLVTPAPEPLDATLTAIWNANPPGCDVQEQYGVAQIEALRRVLSRASDETVALAGVNREILDQYLSDAARVDCGTTSATPAPDTPPAPRPKPDPTPQVAVFDWRDLPVGEPITRRDNFDIPLADLLIPGRYIALLDGQFVAEDTQAIELAAMLELPVSAILEFMPRIGAVVLALPDDALQRMIDHPVVAGLTQDRLGFFNQSQRANNAAQDLVDQIASAPDNQFSPLTEIRDVRVYVVDGGIRADHTEIAGKLLHWRAVGGFHGGLTRYGCERHGTAVASLIAGKTLGIARNVDLIDVDITPCDGKDFTSFPASHILIALDWIAQTQDYLPAEVPTLVNLSLGVPAGDDTQFQVPAAMPADPGLFGLAAFEAKMDAFLDRYPEITIVAAAGNEGANACHYFPARMARVVTVGGSTVSDSLWGNSNFGPCVDTFALAEDVAAADAGRGVDGLSRINGTSFSTAIVTGVIAHRLAAGQDIADIRGDILRIPTTERDIQAQLARGTIPENGAMGATLQSLAKIYSPFRPDCVVSSYDGTLNMRSGPTLQNSVILTLQNGDGLILKGRSGDKWLLVTLQSGIQGWVARADNRATLVQNIQGRADCEN